MEKKTSWQRINEAWDYGFGAVFGVMSAIGAIYFVSYLWTWLTS